MVNWSVDVVRSWLRWYWAVLEDIDKMTLYDVDQNTLDDIDQMTLDDIDQMTLDDIGLY